MTAISKIFSLVFSKLNFKIQKKLFLKAIILTLFLFFSILHQIHVEKEMD